MNLGNNGNNENYRILGENEEVEPQEPLSRISYFVEKIRTYGNSTPMPNNPRGMADYYRGIVDYYTGIRNTSQEQIQMYQNRVDESYGGGKKSTRKHKARKHKKTRRH
jgi:hypothetical protein